MDGTGIEKTLLIFIVTLHMNDTDDALDMAVLAPPVPDNDPCF